MKIYPQMKKRQRISDTVFLTERWLLICGAGFIGTVLPPHGLFGWTAYLLAGIILKKRERIVFKLNYSEKK